MKVSISNLLKKLILQPVKFLLALFVFLNAVLIYVKVLHDYIPPDFSDAFLSRRQSFFEGIYSYAFYAHITSGSVILIAGWLQFIKSLRKKFPAFHRFLGRIYIFLILVSAPAGFIMGYYTPGNWSMKICFMLLAILWFVFTFAAWRQAVNKNFSSHQEFMLRSYALALSAVALRLYSFIAYKMHGHMTPEIYETIAWLSWVPSLVLLEVYFLIRKKLISIK